MIRIRKGPSIAAIGAVATAMLMAACERPPAEREQKGYRGAGMVEVENPRVSAERKAAQLAEIPEIYPPAEPAGQRAGDVHENVQVLADLDVAAFNRLMTAITEWVAPAEEGCNYCHVPNNLASDDIYTKVVARRMLEMTWHVNSEQTEHVGATGVSCFTCHRGEPVPQEVWYETDGPPSAAGLSADRAGQNIASMDAGGASLPYDPYGPYLASQAQQIRVQPLTGLATGTPTDIKKTEQTYALMMHMSGALGVNCTFCHNSRAFSAWEQSTPQRTTAWHGIRMTRQLNTEFLMPLTPAFPEKRLGPKGDVAKVNCATCHQGARKPLYGTAMLEDWPSLAGPPEPEDAAQTSSAKRSDDAGG